MSKMSKREFFKNDDNTARTEQEKSAAQDTNNYAVGQVIPADTKQVMPADTKQVMPALIIF